MPFIQYVCVVEWCVPTAALGKQATWAGGCSCTMRATHLEMPFPLLCIRPMVAVFVCDASLLFQRERYDKGCCKDKFL